MVPETIMILGEIFEHLAAARICADYPNTYDIVVFSGCDNEDQATKILELLKLHGPKEAVRRFEQDVLDAAMAAFANSVDQLGEFFQQEVKKQGDLIMSCELAKLDETSPEEDLEDAE